MKHKILPFGLALLANLGLWCAGGAIAYAIGKLARAALLG